MKIARCGYNHIYPKDFKVCRPQGSGDYIFLVVRSAGYVFFNNERQIVRKNSVILFNKGTPQLFGAYGEELVHDWVHFEADADDINQILELGLNFDVVLEFPSVLNLSDVIRQIYNEFCSYRKKSEEISNVLFRLLLLKLSDNCEDVKKPTYKKDWFDKLSTLRTEIYLKPQKIWVVNEIAQELFINPSYLQRLYKEIFGKTIKQDITHSKLEYAKNLLSSTDYTVSSIAEQSGYRSSEHFIRIFKQNEKVTPTEYRNGR